MKGSSKSGAEENTFIKAYDDLERSNKTPLRGPEAYPLVEIVHGPKQGAWFTIAYQKEITLGRAGTNSIVLEDNSVSRSHAVLQAAGETFSVRDIGSRNGTFLNGKKIQGEVELNHMDIVKLGIYTLRYLQEPTDQVYEMEIKEEHTPRVEGDEGPPKEDTKSEAALSPHAEEEVPALVREPKKEDKTAHEDINAIIAHQAPTPAVATGAKPSRGLRNLLVLLLILGVVGGGGYLAYYFGALDKVKSWFGSEPQTPKTAKKETPTQPPKVIKPEEPKTPPQPSQGQVIPVFLEATSQPIPGKVFYKGNELGLTPFRISVQVPSGKPEEVTAEFNLDALGQKWTEKTTIQVTKQDEIVAVKFAPKWGNLKLVTFPKTGELFLEGKLANGTELKPIKLQNLTINSPIYLPQGHFIAQIQVPEKLGDSNSQVNAIKYRREFDLSDAAPVFEINVTDEGLKTFPAHISSEPGNAELLVDGKKFGVTPFDGNLPTGKHKLVLKKEGFNDFEKEISIDLNTPYSANYNLATTASGEYINKGRDLIRRGLYNEGIEQLAEALKRNPEPSEMSQIHLLLGNAFLKTKTYDQALAYFQKAKESPELNLEGELGIAEAMGGLGQNDQAIVKLINIVVTTKDDKVRSQAESLYHKIAPMRSVMYVVSDPPGAQVMVNGNPTGQATPVVLSDIMVGSYRLGLQKDGYKPYESRVSVSLSVIKPVVVKLEANPQ